MNRQQFKRLTLVLALPLLALGAWMASEEMIIKAHRSTYCEEFATHFTCFSTNSTQREAMREIWQGRTVSMMNTAVLVNGFNHEVRTLGVVAMSLENGAWKEVQMSPAGVVQQLVLPRASSNSMGFGESCRISRKADAPIGWYADCGTELAVPFEFVDASVSEKFETLVTTVRAEREKTQSDRVKLLVFATLLPLICYFALSLVVSLALRLVRFVRGPVAAA